MSYKIKQIINLLIILILMGLSIAVLADEPKAKKRNYCTQYYEFAVKMRKEKKRYEYQIAKRMANACSSALKQGGMKNIDARIGQILDLHQKNDKELQRKEEAKAKKTIKPKKQKVVSIPAELLGNRYQG